MPEPEPPLVVRVEPAPPARPRPARPRPGLPEAVLWCVAFLGAQLVGAMVVAAAILGITSLGAEDPSQFLTDQLGGLVKATSAAAPAAERPPAPREIGTALAWGMFGAQVFSLLMIAVVVPRRIGPDWKRQIGWRRPAGMHVFLTVLMLPGFIICSSGIEYLVVQLTGAKQLVAVESLRGVFTPWPAWLTVLTVGVGPGIVEELWCRGFLGRGLCARYGLTAGVLLTSVLFGLLHVHPAYALVVTFMGAYLHFVYLASRSIWIPVLLHALNNGVGMVMVLNGVMMQMQPKADNVVGVVYLAAFSLLLFGSVAMWTGRAELRGPKLKEPTFVPEYPGISAPPPGSDDTLGRAETSPAAVAIALLSFGVLAYLLTR